ncbi:MAG TPA: FixH family protein [Solirubrobacter sp.]|nr:FixH family protein [Solirubrobacter sp.]
MRRVLFALPVVALLVFAPSAFAGGWATVGLSSTPAGTAPGSPWNVQLTILQHGRTPLDGLSPAITIRNGTEKQTFNATPAGKPGVYRASVVFPRAGTWTYEVDDGFVTGAPHTFPPVKIDPASAPAAARTSDDGGPALGWLAIPGIALLVAAAALLAWDRTRRHQPQAA